jgi:hypothetical protein
MENLLRVLEGPLVWETSCVTCYSLNTLAGISMHTTEDDLTFFTCSHGSQLRVKNSDFPFAQFPLESLEASKFWTFGKEKARVVEASGGFWILSSSFRSLSQKLAPPSSSRAKIVYL